MIIRVGLTCLCVHSLSSFSLPLGADFIVNLDPLVGCFEGSRFVNWILSGCGRCEGAVRVECSSSLWSQIFCTSITGSAVLLTLATVDSYLALIESRWVLHVRIQVAAVVVIIPISISTELLLLVNVPWSLGCTEALLLYLVLIRV